MRRDDHDRSAPTGGLKTAIDANPAAHRHDPAGPPRPEGPAVASCRCRATSRASSPTAASSTRARSTPPTRSAAPALSLARRQETCCTSRSTTSSTSTSRASTRSSTSSAASTSTSTTSTTTRRGTRTTRRSTSAPATSRCAASTRSTTSATATTTTRSPATRASRTSCATRRSSSASAACSATPATSSARSRSRSTRTSAARTRSRGCSTRSPARSAARCARSGSRTTPLNVGGERLPDRDEGADPPDDRIREQFPDDARCPAPLVPATAGAARASTGHHHVRHAHRASERPRTLSRRRPRCAPRRPARRRNCRFTVELPTKSSASGPPDRQAVSRRYELRDLQGHRHHSYRITWANPAGRRLLRHRGDDWTNPPLFAHADTVARYGRRYLPGRQRPPHPGHRLDRRQGALLGQQHALRRPHQRPDGRDRASRLRRSSDRAARDGSANGANRRPTSRSASATRRLVRLRRLAPAGRAVRQARGRQSRRQRQGPHRRRDDRGRRARGADRAGPHDDRRGDQRQHRHRAGDGLRRQGLRAGADAAAGDEPRARRRCCASTARASS